MRDIVLMLFISLFFQITNKCQKTGFSTYEECFASEITEKEIDSGESVDDYTCCYLRQLPSQGGECLLLEKYWYTNIHWDTRWSWNSSWSIRLFRRWITWSIKINFMFFIKSTQEDKLLYSLFIRFRNRRLWG